MINERCHKNYGNFAASSSVRSDATLESVGIFKTEIEKYIQEVSDADLQFTKDALLKSNARNYETLGALLGMLQTISIYGLPIDYVKREEAFLKGYTAVQHKQFAQKYLVPSKLCYVVVGDAATQMAPLEQLGLGKPVLVK